MDTTYYPTSPEKRALAHAAAASSAAASAAPHSGQQVAPYGPVPRGSPLRLGPTDALAAVAPLSEGQPSAAFGARRQLFEAQAQKDELRMQLQSIKTQFQARENWWRTNVLQSRNEVVDGVFQNHQLEQEARQQWEQRLRSVESLVDEASSYCNDQSRALHDRSELVIQL